MRDWYEIIDRDMMKKNNEGGLVLEEDETPGADKRVVTVTSYLSLIALFGFVKYSSHSQVLLRGQTSDHGNLLPSALRAHKPESIQEELEELLDDIRNALRVDLAPNHRPTTEPLFQHYGLKTRWLDLVDSVPHALYFALHKLNFKDGAATPEEAGTDREWGYLYLIDCGPDETLTPVRVLQREEVITCKGVWRASNGFMLCDLRRAKPSKAVRPHAQHGYLCRPADSEPDLWKSRLLVRVRVPREKAESWIGGSSMQYDSMFPPGNTDRNYRKLLRPVVNEAIEQWKARKSRELEPGSIIRYHGEVDPLS